MKRSLVLALAFAASLAPASALAQPGADQMQGYFFVFLKRGAHADDVPKEKRADIQKGHMDNITKLARDGKLVLAGPFTDDGDLRGIFILNVATLEEAKKLCDGDPAVASGRLQVEIHPWYGPKGIRSDFVLEPETKMIKQNPQSR